MAIRIKDIMRGTTRNIDVIFTQEDGSPHDLTGASVFMAVTDESAPSDDSGAAIDITPVTEHVDAEAGQSRIELSADDTDIAAGTYNVGVQAVLADGTVIEDTGKVKVLQDYKKATS